MAVAVRCRNSDCDALRLAHLCAVLFVTTPTRLVYATLLAVTGTCLPTAALADAPAASFEIDFAAARRSALGDEITLMYAAMLGHLEGSFANPDAPAMTIDRASCTMQMPNAYNCRLRGRFTPSAFATIRSLDPNATADTATVGVPGVEGERASLRVCSDSLWIIGSTPPPAGACAQPPDANEDSVYAQLSARRHLAMRMNVPALGIPLGGIAVMRIGVTFDETVEGRYVLTFEDAARARAFRAAIEAGTDLGPLMQYGFTIDADSVRGAGSELSMRVTGAASALREFIVGLFFGAIGSDETTDAEPAPHHTLEPMAEIEALRERIASELAPVTAHDAMGTDVAMPIVMLSAEDYTIDDALFDALSAPISGMRPRLFFLVGDGITPTWERAWTHRAEALLADVRSRVQSAAMNVDPCTEGCVLVASGASTDLAIELATLDPARFPHVVLREVYRADALPFLAEVQTLPSGVSFTLFASEDEDPEPGDGIEALLGAFARKRPPRDTRVVRGDMASFARATHVPLGTRQRVRAGALDTTPPRRQTVAEGRARACRRGDAAACYATYATARGDGPLPEDMPKHTVLALDRSCAMGHGYACYLTANRYEEDELLFVASLSHACDLGSADACTLLGYGFDVGRGLPTDDHMALSLYVRGCTLGAPRGCENAVLTMRHAATRPRLEDAAVEQATATIRPLIAEPTMRARMRALCTDARVCTQSDAIEAWLTETAPANTTDGAR